MTNLAWLNGQLLPLDEARVSVMDRGFLFGDGVYELIPVYSRRPFRLDEHLTRLAASLAAIRIANPHTRNAWREIIEQVIQTSSHADQSIYLQVTRGPAAVRNHAFPPTVTPTVFLMSEPLVPPTDAVRSTGVAAITATDIRWLRCDLKVTSLLANCLMRQAAIDAGCVEAVLLRDGNLTEGAASNIFIVSHGQLLAPPKTPLMLAGITYDVVLEIAALHHLPHAVRSISAAELFDADEIWLTSSTKEVLPIVRLDGKAVGNGAPGAVARQMHIWYQEFKATVMRHG